MTMIGSAEIAAYVVFGAAIGVAYFALLLKAVHMLASGEAPLLLVSIHVGRITGAVLVFWFVAQQGAVALLVTFLGFLIARTAFQHWTKRA